MSQKSAGSSEVSTPKTKPRKGDSQGANPEQVAEAPLTPPSPRARSQARKVGTRAASDKASAVRTMRETMFKTPLPFMVPSLFFGAALSFDIGSRLHWRRFSQYLAENAKEADRLAILSDFVVLGDDMLESAELFESQELEQSSIRE